MASESENNYGSGHDRSKVRPSEDDEDDDPVERMLKKAGCLELHYKVQECMFNHKDWRKCQTEVHDFRKCINDSKEREKQQKS